MMEIKEFKELLFAKARAAGFEQYEVYFSESESSIVSVYKSKLEKYSESDTCGLGFRGIYKGKMGYGYTEIFNEDAADSLINEAKSNAELNEEEREEFIFSGSKEYEKLDVYDKELASLTVDKKTELALKAEKAAMNYDSRVRVNKSSVNYLCTSKLLANSTGLELEEKSNYMVCSVEVIAESGDNVKEKYDFDFSKSISGINPVLLGESAAKKAVASLGGSSVKSGDYRVIFNNEVFAEILECFCGCFSAENVQKGFSLLKGKLGQRVASNKITIADNALLLGGCSTTAFDSEGVASQNTILVKNGFLNSYLYNLKTAGADKTTSTGNGFKGSYKGSVSIIPTNLYIESGTVEFDELLRQLNNGLLITDVAGLHSGANTVSGSFSLAAEGFRVENGKITTAIEQITVAGNFYELLLEAKELADDLYFNPAVGSPSILFENIHISGL